MFSKFLLVDKTSMKYNAQVLIDNDVSSGYLK